MALPAETGPSPADLLLNFQTQFADAAAAFRGAVAQLEDQGFTVEQARQMVADLIHMAAVQIQPPEGGQQ